MKQKQSLRSVLLGGFAVGCLVVSAGALAADNKVEVSSDTSKNPITGTVTETKKHEEKVKRADGKTAKVNVTEKVKHKTDGSVEQKVDASASNPGAPKK